MPFLACVHHVQWLTAVPGGKFQCSYCRAFVQKKDIYPKWDDLGPDFQAWWTTHEATAPVPSPVNPPTASAAAPIASPRSSGAGPDTPAQPEQKPASDTENAPHAPRKPDNV